MGKEDMGNKEKNTCPLDLYPPSNSETDLWLNLVIKSLSPPHYLLRSQTHLHAKFCVTVIHQKDFCGAKVAGVSGHSQLVPWLGPGLG